jgi:hypothetical protein
MAISVAVLAGLVTLALLFKLFFRDLEGFQECLEFAVKPDILSWVTGDLGEDLWAELRLFAWIVCGGLVGLGVYVGLDRIFG